MLIEFPIGDWSEDGHNQYETFLIEVTGEILSALPKENILELVRETHFDLKSKGIDIGSYCSDYGDAMLCMKDVDTIEDAGFDFGKIKDHLLYHEDVGYEMTVETMILLWVSLLNWANPSLGLMIKPKPENTIPRINFYGKDEKDRHLKVPGYGLFNL